IEAALHPEPRRARLVRRVAMEAELLLEHAPPAGRVDHEAGLDRRHLAVRRDQHHPMGRIPLPDLDVAHAPPFAEARAGLLEHRAQVVLEAAAIDLEARHRRLLARPVLAALVELGAL